MLFHSDQHHSHVVTTMAKSGTFVITGDLKNPQTVTPLVKPLLSNFRQYSWAAGSEFQKLLRQVWKYVQAFEDEHYQIYYKRNINEETLQDYSSAIQEIIPRLTKIQSILNHNSRGFPDMMRWVPPSDQPMDLNASMKEGAQDCQEFAIFSRAAANQNTPVSAQTAGAIIQGALACQAAASKTAAALQRTKFGDPVCDPHTVIASHNMSSVTALISCNDRRKVHASFI